jgi:S1-C subfamily serine protease
VNWIDAVILAALALALFSGYRRGAIMQAFSWGGFVLGLIVGAIVGPSIVQAFDPSSGFSRAMIGLGSFLGIAFIIEIIVSIAGAALARRITAPMARKVDAWIGAIVGAFLSLFAAWILGFTLSRGPSPELGRAIKGSAILRLADRIAPHPPDFLAEIGHFLNRSGFPDVFARLNPNLAPGVAPPPASLANEGAILAAASLTYKIESAGCGGIVDGSGFPVDPHIVITAAHVIAGTGDTHVISSDGDTFAAVPIYLNTSIDVAVLRVSNMPRDDLRIASGSAPRGEDGAAIGYPGGGRRVISPARVRARTEAVGRDIYSRRLTSREIYVLRARVRQGNSGGPFVDTRGRVRGMIFAASESEPDESYALAENELQTAVQRALERNRRVGTGECAV